MNDATKKMELEKGDSQNSSEKINSEDSREESIIGRAIDQLRDTPSEKFIGGAGKDNIMDSKKRPFETNSNQVRHQPPEMTISPRYEPNSLRYDTANQLSHQQHPNNNIPGLPPPIHPVVSAAGQTSLNEILGALQESKWFIFRVILLMILLAFIHIWITQPVYRADALLEVEERVRGTGSVADRSKELADEEAVVSEEVEVLKSRTVHGDVVDKLKLDLIARPKYFPFIGIAIAGKNPVVKDDQMESIDGPHADAKVNESAQTNSDYMQPVLGYIQTLKMKLFDWLESTEYAWGNEHIDVEKLDVPDSAIGKIFTIVAGENSHYKLLNKEGAELGNGIVGEQIEMQLPDGKLVLLVSDIVATPGKYFEVQRKSRTEVISVLQNNMIVREKAGVVSSGLLGVTLEGTDKIRITAIVNEVMDTYIRQNVERKATNTQKRLTFMEEQLAVLEESMNKAEQGLNDYRQQEGSIDLATESEVLLKRIVEVEAEISRLTRSRLELTQRFKSKHPNVVSLDSQVGILKRELNELNEQVKKLPGTEQQVLRMTRDVDVQTTLYSFLTNKVQELKVNIAGQVGNLRVVDYAAIPYEPVKPQPKVLLVAYILLGLIISIGASFFRRALKAGIHDPEVIETRLGLTVHATIPLSQKQNKLMKRGAGKTAKKRILAAVDPEDPAIEGLRGLRTSLYFAQAESRNNLILITGPAPDVGKSFVSINYATILVSAGKRVLVIDADFRKGSINEYVGMEHYDGLTDLITGKISAKDAIRNTDIEGLDILPTGKMIPNPSELLLHENFAVQLQEVSGHYDYVIIDAPPVLALSDAAVIGRLAGLSLLVVKSGMHTQRQLQHTIKQLQKAGVRLEGVVFNGLDTTNTAYGYGQNYGYAYSYYHKKS